jgi:hypothetical protein
VTLSWSNGRRAFALIGHAARDAVHYVQYRVVARSYAEFCAVLDLLIGAAILYEVSEAFRHADLDLLSRKYVKHSFLGALRERATPMGRST